MALPAPFAALRSLWGALWHDDTLAAMQAVAFPHFAGGIAGGTFDRTVDTPINQMRLLDALLRRAAQPGQGVRCDG